MHAPSEKLHFIDENTNFTREVVLGRAEKSSGSYSAGRPIIRKVLKTRIWVVPPAWAVGSYSSRPTSRAGELPKSSSSKPSERSDAPDCT